MALSPLQYLDIRADGADGCTARSAILLLGGAPKITPFDRYRAAPEPSRTARTMITSATAVFYRRQGLIPILIPAYGHAKNPRGGQTKS
jgi:hypothetical protein